MTTAPTDPKTRTKTSYAVLRIKPATGPDNPTPLYELVKNVDATNSNDAIKQAAGKQEGSYIAIPARSFTPVKVTVTQQTIVKLA